MFRDYIIPLSFIDTKAYNQLSEQEIIKEIVCIGNWIDCTKLSSMGTPIVSTISYMYKYDISRILYLIDKINDDDKKKAQMNWLTNVHQKNLDYEKDNPPVIYKKKKRNTPRRGTESAKQTTLKGFENSDKETAAEKKLKAKAAKLNKLGFKFNSI